MPIVEPPRILAGSKDDYKRVLRGDACAYCDARTGETGTVDHVIPRAAGARSWRENLVGACESCNKSKADTTLLFWLLYRRDIGLRG
jgi:hypothetical protein